MSASGTPIELRAGPLTAVFDRGELRWIRLGPREVIRGIYGSVRGAGWKTVLPRIEDLDVQSGTDDFRITFRARHEDGTVRFTWEALIEGHADGSIRFAFDGVAEAAFARNRIGVCVLHPVEGCAGRSCVVEHVSGSTTEETFPYHLSPHQPFFDVRALRYEVGRGLEVEVRFTGETFEVEDQRNWSDASYKTYPTPLARPFPVEVEPGTRVRQEVAVRILETSGDAEQAAATAARSGPPPPVFGAPAPQVGVAFVPPGRLLTSREIERVRAMKLDHVRVDLDLRRPGWAEVLARASEVAAGADTTLWLAVSTGTNADDSLGELAEEVAHRRAPVSAALLFDAETGITTPGLVDMGRRRLGAAAPDARFGAGSNLFFTELNRNRGAADGGDFVAFPLSPQVHAYDDATVRENVGSLRWIAATVRSFAGARPLALSPVSLRVRGQGADPRQRTAFGVEWTKQLLTAAHEAGIASLTLYEVTGPAGLMDGEELFPVYGVLADRVRSPRRPE